MQNRKQSTDTKEHIVMIIHIDNHKQKDTHTWTNKCTHTRTHTTHTKTHIHTQYNDTYRMTYKYLDTQAQLHP